MKELTEEAFRKWLRYVRKSRRFTKQNECKCPLAQYTGCNVTRLHVIPKDSAHGGWVALPSWAKNFIDAFDTSPGARHRRLDKVGVLRILNSLSKPATSA